MKYINFEMSRQPGTLTRHDALEPPGFRLPGGGDPRRNEDDMCAPSGVNVHRIPRMVAASTPVRRLPRLGVVAPRRGTDSVGTHGIIFLLITDLLLAVATNQGRTMDSLIVHGRTKRLL